MAQRPFSLWKMVVNFDGTTSVPFLSSIGFPPITHKTLLHYYQPTTTTITTAIILQPQELALLLAVTFMAGYKISSKRGNLKGPRLIYNLYDIKRSEMILWVLSVHVGAKYVYVPKFAPRGDSFIVI